MKISEMVECLDFHIERYRPYKEYGKQEWAIHRTECFKAIRSLVLAVEDWQKMASNWMANEKKDDIPTDIKMLAASLLIRRISDFGEEGK